MKKLSNISIQFCRLIKSYFEILLSEFSVKLMFKSVKISKYSVDVEVISIIKDLIKSTQTITRRVLHFCNTMMEE